MAKKNCFIVSLKFSPGLKREFISLGDSLAGHDFEVFYLLSESYKNIESERDNSMFLTDSESLTSTVLDMFKLMGCRQFVRIFSQHAPYFVLFYNTHPLNPFIARMLRRNFSSAITALYLHDPHKPDKRVYGFNKTIYIHMIEMIQRLTVRNMDHVISPSSYSAQLFHTFYPHYRGKTHVAPLLMPDLRCVGEITRRYFSAVGRAHPATGHELLMETINLSAEKQCDFEFVIISSGNSVDRYLPLLTEGGRKG